jgi:hypothetical protein
MRTQTSTSEDIKCNINNEASAKDERRRLEDGWIYIQTRVFNIEQVSSRLLNRSESTLLPTEAFII